MNKDKELIKNNKIFEMIAENINEGFWVLDAGVEKVLYISPGFKRVSGKSINDQIENPKTFLENVYPEDLERIKSATDKFIAGMHLHADFRIIRPDGTIRWIEAQGFPVKDASGKITYNVGIIKDITEQKQAEENLKSERDFSDAALNSLPAVFSLNDSTGKYLRWNKNLETVSGYTAEEIKTLHPSKIVAGSDMVSMSQRMEKVFQKGFVYKEADLICKNGKVIPYYFTGRPFYYKDIPCVISIGIDISERKKNAIELQKEKETAQKYLDIAGVMLIAVDKDLNIILANKKACDTLGYEEKELIGKNAINILVPEAQREKDKIFNKQLISGEIEISESTKLQGIILTKKGEKKIIEWNDTLLRDETGKATGILASGEDVSERIKMQEMILKTKNDWEETFDTINDAITIHDDKYNIIRANKTAKEMLEISADGSSNLKCHKLYHNSDSPLPDCPCSKALKTGEISIHKIFEPHLARHLEIKVIPRFDKNNSIIGSVHIVKDISDQVKAEEKQSLLQSQLLHMQKMESIGRLAGGVAHDFNNILSGILGFSELALLDIPEDNPLKERIELIIGLGEKAGALTQQLLAFSRKQTLIIKDIDINTVVTDMVKMLKRIIGEDIKLNLKLSEKTRKALCDQNQMEQVLLNLAVNSRDAMPNGGVLTIETDNIIINDDNLKYFESMNQGEYVKLTISDTGCGMSSEVIENIFEPFYTTKGIGKGTGLGLATVYGIIKQHNGYIYATSKPNQGSTFILYLPVSNLIENKPILKSDVEQIKCGTETILIVDDEPILLSIIEKALKPLGYRLLIAVSVKEAMTINNTFEGTIDLLITDIIMPDMNGKELADKIASVRPNIKVMFMSGYPEDSIEDQKQSKESGFYLQKPLRISVIRQKLREVLDNKYA